MPDVHGSDSDFNGSYFEERARAVGSVLAVPVAEHLGEGLREAAFRATSRNAFRITDIVVELSRAKSFRSVSSINEGAVEELDRLVGVLGIRKEAEHVRALLSNNGFAGKDWVRYFGVNIRRGHLVKGRRVAPRSLRKLDCLEAVWSLRPFGFDLKTKEVLLGRCPICKRTLGWRHTFGPSFCDRCPSGDDAFHGGVDLRDFPQPIADVRDDEAIDLFASLVDPAAPRRGVALHPDLANCNDGDIFQLLIEIGNRLDGNPAGWGRVLRTQSIEQAGRAILNWPKGFDELLEQTADQPATSEFRARFDQLHLQRRLSANVRQALSNRLDSRLRRQLSCKVSDTIRETGTNRRSTPIRNAYTEVRAAHRRQGEMASAEVAVLFLRRSRLARQLSVYLGLPLPYLLDLFCEGMLPELEPTLDGILAPPTGRQRSVFDELSTVANCRSSCPDPLSVWSLCFASSASNGLAWVDALRAICEGRLQVSQKRDRIGLVHQLQCHDLAHSNLGHVFRKKVSTVDRLPLTQGELAKAIGKSPAVVRHLVGGNLLPRNATGRDLQDFRDRWVFASEIQDLFHLRDCPRPPNLRAFLIQYGVTTISTETATLWSRMEVNELMSSFTSPPPGSAG